MGVQCRINLENETGYYTNGSEIRGRVEYTLAKPKCTKGISIHLICTEYNTWSETKRIGTITYMTTYVGHYQPICSNVLVYQPSSEHDVLQPGFHTFDFAFKLPYNLPSSYKGPFGYVSYKVEAKMHGFKKFDHPVFFNVLSLINLASLGLSYFEPTTLSNDKTVCCWCCSRGQVSIEASLPKLAFLLGERIPISVRLSNNSASPVKGLRVELKQLTAYKVDRPSTKTRHDSKTMLKFKQEGVQAKGQHTYDMELVVPRHLETPNFSLCKLFVVSYELKIIAQMGAFALNLEITALPRLGHLKVVGNVNQGISFVSPDYYVSQAEPVDPPPPGFSEELGAPPQANSAEEPPPV